MIRRSAVAWLLLCLHAAHGKKPVVGEGKQAPSILLLSVKAPEALQGAFAGESASFSAQLPSSDEEFEVHVPPPADRVGCGTYTLPSSRLRTIALVRRGNCTFVQKALNAQAAGAAGILVAFDNEQIFVMGGSNDTSEDDKVQIFAGAVGNSLGKRLADQASLNSAGSGGIAAAPVVLTVSKYQPSVLDLSELILILMATSLVAAGAMFSTSDMRTNAFSAAIAPPQEEVLEVDSMMAGSFCVMGSAMLVFLFFFMNYMIYFIMFAFCVGGASCLTQFGSMCLQHFAPRFKTRVADVPLLGPVTQAELLAGGPAVVLVTCWLVLRNTPYGWPFQDIIGAGFLCWMQRTLRLPNIRIASLLLVAMFFFDIFWVFISPLFFTKSVMVTVATGGDTGESVPMLLRIPSFGDPLGHDRLLGFGDIALPGLLVSYLRRHDLQSHRRLCEGYFGPALIGYFVGLCVTIVALMIMQMGQPALLYLVPGTLGTTMILSCCRGEMSLLWDGKAARGDRRPVEDGGNSDCA
eukprot:TRINITY_DN14879_c0_g1_i1.p1 TRINITY_DN14879_c0_g1~~TRINITY_DN14879_c0_g1_i1.p1  ORF type:complete len:521 (+),score=88.58 TRINITY_DN14879_c0_g1_i1:99-1661(+)